MINNGKLLNNDLFKNSFKLLIVKYFNNPTLIKINNNFNNMSVYICKLKSMLVNEKRYLIVNVENDSYPLYTKRSLNELDWKTLQTKQTNKQIVNDNIEIPNFSYNVRDNQKNIDYHSLINIVEHKDNYSIYSSEKYNFCNFILLNNDNNIYPDKGYLFIFLETYNSIIEFTNNN